MRCELIKSFSLPMFSLRAGFKSRIYSAILFYSVNHIDHLLRSRNPFDVVTGRGGMISNSGGVTNLRKSFEVLRLFVMQSFGFTNLESIIIPATGFDFCEQLINDLVIFCNCHF